MICRSIARLVAAKPWHEDGGALLLHGVGGIPDAAPGSGELVDKLRQLEVQNVMTTRQRWKTRERFHPGSSVE